MEIIINIGQLDEETSALDENLVFSDVISKVIKLFGPAYVNTVTIRCDIINHLIFKRVNGVINIIGKLKYGVLNDTNDFS